MNFFKKLFGRKNNETDKSPAPQKTNEEIEMAYKSALAQLEPFKRIAYIPETVEIKPGFSSTSKIGGYPYLRDEHDWPVCPNCNKNMQLFLQLNNSEIPNSDENGLIQLFYCTNSEPLCESDLEAFFPFSKSVVCRKIDIGDEPVVIEPNIDELFPEMQITGWIEKDDYPHYEEYQILGIDLELEDDVFELMESRKKGLPLEGDKLNGWPYWVQSVEYPYDRTTESRMNLLFQLDSEVNLPYMFGDSGIGHLTQSPDNEQELAFGWACC